MAQARPRKTSAPLHPRVLAPPPLHFGHRPLFGSTLRSLLARPLRRAGGRHSERARAQLRALRAPGSGRTQKAQWNPRVRGRDGRDQPLRERAADQAQPSPKRLGLRCPQAEASPEVVPLEVRPRGRPKVPRLGNDALLTQAKDLPGRACRELTDDRESTIAAYALPRARVRASAAALMRPAATTGSPPTSGTTVQIGPKPSLALYVASAIGLPPGQPSDDGAEGLRGEHKLGPRTDASLLARSPEQRGTAVPARVFP